MKTADFDFDLPRQLIASRPSEKRDFSKLLILHKDGSVEHKFFFNVIDYLEEGDMLLMNNTKVFPARIMGKRIGGQAVDILLVREKDGKELWEILCKGQVDGPVTVFDGVEACIETHYSADCNERRRCLRLPGSAAAIMDELLLKYGNMPLPHYISRMPDDADKERYQTVYATQPGSIAAPTAGLHFTGDLLEKIRNKGILVRFLTLHVGTGTFKPVKAQSLEGHRMDAEYFELEKKIFAELELVKSKGRKIVAVGTTTTRALESVAGGTNCFFVDTSLNLDKLRDVSTKLKGTTDIFIYPGFRFKAVDCLLTNFHLPRSTPLMLVSALSDFVKIMKAYREAAAMDYRFFSYGDAMLIL